jgi:hypothetical protein
MNHEKPLLRRGLRAKARCGLGQKLGPGSQMKREQMKKPGLLFGLAALLAAQNVFAALTATLTEDVGNSTGGGAFKAVTSENGTFDTFCVSINTEFDPGVQYNYTISPTIVANPAPSGYPPNPPTYISYGTAYIYNQFLHHNANYGGTLNSTTVNDVQYTIWYLQGLLNPNYQDPRGYDYSSEVPLILNQLFADTHLSLAALQANGYGAFGVEALDLHDGTFQPQLIEPVPEPTTMLAGALLLLPLAASSMRILRRNRRGESRIHGASPVGNAG